MKYIQLAQDVLTFGNPVDSRYGPCVELIGGAFTCPANTLLQRNGINYALGWMELLQLVAGTFELDAIKRVAPKSDHSLFTFAMAYGPRVYDQVPTVLDVLRRNPESRQAVLHIAKPEDGPTSSKPCTLTIQFLIRNGEIHAIVSMRSWDLCRGLPYDIMMFGGLLKIFAVHLNVDAGNVLVQAGSAHIYEDQKHRIPWIVDKVWDFVESPATWGGFVGWARRNILNLQTGGIPEGIVYQTKDEL